MGRKTYEVSKGKGKPSQRHIDDLKTYEIGDDLLKKCKVNPKAIEAAIKNVGDLEDPDVTYENIQFTGDEAGKTESSTLIIQD